MNRHEFSISLSGEFISNNNDIELVKSEIINHFTKDKSNVDSLYVDDIVVIKDSEENE